MSVKQRYDALRPAIGATFDLPAMARTVYGAGWDALTDAQKAEWAQAFADYVAASYAARLDGFNGKGFERDAKTTTRDQNVVVTSRVILADGPPMPLDYVVRPDSAGLEDRRHPRQWLDQRTGAMAPGAARHWRQRLRRFDSNIASAHASPS